MVTAALTSSQVPTNLNLNGSEGSSLLNSLTESPLNQTNDSLNATNHSINLDGIKSTSSDLWSWGTKPKYDSSNSTETDYLSDPAFNL